MKMNTIARESGPSSSIGIMRFFDTDSGGPKISPEFVIGIAIVFTIAIMVLQIVR